VSLQRLTRQLQRDFRANRKKAVALGLLVLVAGWFWYPLVFKSKGSQAAPPPAPAAAVTTPVVAVSVAPAAAHSYPAWKDVSQWIESDKRMQPFVTVSGELANPFVARNVETPTVEEAQPPQLVAADLEPEALGLELTSTAVGRKQRIASISGKIYREGDDIPTATGVVFKLKSIGPSGVIVTCGEKHYTLNLKRTGQSARADSRIAQ
jgi:hypothetical protein